MSRDLWEENGNGNVNITVYDMQCGVIVRFEITFMVH